MNRLLGSKGGQYDLKITNLELSDEGIFYCQVVVDGVSFSSAKAILQVLVPSDPPKLIQRNNQGYGLKEEKSVSNPIIVNDGDDLVIDCIAKHGRPGAKILWFINDMNIAVTEGIVGAINGTFSGEIQVSITPSKKNPKLYNSLSTLNIKINSLRHGNWLKCIAENSGFENERLKTALAQIEVHTTPLVKIESYPSRMDNTFVENDVIEFSCSATGRPSTFSWKWYMNEKVIENIIVSKYKARIVRSNHNSTLKCVAVSTREGFNSIKIFVKYGPKFINENTIMYAASLGENVEMSCKTDSNPKASITWERESSKDIISSETNLILKNIQESDFGIYRCTAMASGFTSVFKTSYLAKKRAPTMQQPSVSYGFEGQSARLSCSIRSVPLPKDSEMKWIFRNKLISKSNRYKIHQEAFLDGVMTILQISLLNSDDFGDYNCTVETSLGSASSSAILIPRGETPVLMIVGASIIFLFILFVTTVVLCICRKNKYKNDYEKGNPSSPDIPVHNDVKSTLIDSDCHCNPNLYSWISQTLDVRENRGLLNKIQNQDERLWSKATDSLTAYPNYLPAGYTNNNTIPINKHENMIYNPLIYNLQSNTLETSDINTYSSNFPFATLSISRNPHNDTCDTSQIPNCLYQDICPNINVQTPMNLYNADMPSPVYVTKKNSSQKQRQFPTDYYQNSKPTITTNTMDSASNFTKKMVPDYASNI